MNLFASEALGIRCIFDPTRLYRYVWSYELGDPTKRCFFIMLNPSTADEHVLDPTVKKCVKWARAWGFGALDVCNLFAWRATDPSELYHILDPVGPDNDRWIEETIAKASMVVCGWGNHASKVGVKAGSATWMRRDKHIALMFTRLGVEPYCLGVNADGSPEHPLYIANATKPTPWRAT